MSSSAPIQRYESTSSPTPRPGILTWLKPFVTSSVGMKATTAVTGFLLTGFVIVHLIGNLNVFAGPDAVNGYAKFLKDMGPGLWIFRGALLAVFLLHVILALTLAWRTRAARPVRYQHPATIQATRASLTMPWTGLAILAFAAFHLAHYTFGWMRTVQARSVITGKMKESNYLDLVDNQGRHDVYTMVVKGFENPYVCAFYLIAMALLFVHLKHGIGSAFQSLGLNTPRLQPFIRRLSVVVAALITLGNVAIVVLVWAGQVPVDPVPLTSAGAEDIPTPLPPGAPSP